MLCRVMLRKQAFAAVALWKIPSLFSQCLYYNGLKTTLFNFCRPIPDSNAQIPIFWRWYTPS